MSGDPTYLITDVTNLAQLAILLLGIYRALEMRRGFVDSTYRSRALWSIFLMTAVVATLSENLIPQSNDLLGISVGVLPFLAIIGVSFAFIDRTVLVSISSDFFHRNVLGWVQVRKPAGIALAATLVFLEGCAVLTSLSLLPGSSSPGGPFLLMVAFDLLIVVAVAVLGLGGVAAAVGSRRTPDKTLNRNIRLLSLALLLFVLSLVTSSISSTDPVTILGDFLTLGATIFLYLSVMSLTPLGRVERDVGPSSRESVAAQAS